MLLRPGILFAAAAGLVAAVGDVLISRDFASVEGALDNVNALLLQINEQTLNLNAQNIASVGPALLQLGQNIQPMLQTFSQQVLSSNPLSVDETNGLNTARTALSKFRPRFSYAAQRFGHNYFSSVNNKMFAVGRTIKDICAPGH